MLGQIRVFLHQVLLQARTLTLPHRGQFFGPLWITPHDVAHLLRHDLDQVFIKHRPLQDVSLQ
jgi:hypothetical protein